MIDVRQPQRAYQKTLDRKQDVIPAWPALMGDGAGTVEVSTRSGWVYVRVGSDEILGQAFNNRVPNRDNLPVLVGYEPVQPDLYQVLSIREVYAGADSGHDVIPQVPSHHETHEWMGDDGCDLVYVHLRQWMPLRLRVVNGMTVQVDRGVMYRGGWVEVSTQQMDLTGCRPTGGGRYVLMYLDADGILGARSGDVVVPASGIALTDIPEPGLSEFPLAAVMVYGGQTSVQDNYTYRNVMDLRWPQFSTTGQAVVTKRLAEVEAELDFALSTHVVSG